jgi:hypothetical protein
LRLLGSRATEHVIGINNLEEQLPTLVRKPDKLITAFFEKRYDLLTSFDDDTEAAIARNGVQRMLIEDARNRRTQIVKTGVMMSEKRPHPEAYAARDALRRNRLKLYFVRVVAHNRLAAIHAADAEHGQAS